MKKELSQKIISRLPYSNPFLFVDDILEVNKDSIKGCYTFTSDLDFYRGHFKDKPVTPGVILTECMAQIGVVCLGIYLMEEETENNQIAMTSSEIEYFKPVYPEEKVTVFSKKIYYRFGKLKCSVEMVNLKEEIVAKGIIAGMIHKPKVLTE